MQQHGSRRTALTNPEGAFGRILQQIRKEHGLSQEQLGFESGYHPTYIGLLERGRRNPTLRAILRLAAALKVSASDIVGRVEAYLGNARKERPSISDRGQSR